MTREPSQIEAVDEAEKQLHITPAESRAALAALAAGDDPEARVRARAVLAIAEATARSGEGLRRARAWLDEAEGETGAALSPATRGRLAQARGYLAHREADDDGALRWLDEAAALLAPEPSRRARVLDTLGMVLGRRGDLDGARDYFALSLELKQANQADARSLALTLGNLGRLALVAELHDEAERWLRRDLDLALAAGERPATVAHVRNQLALALAGQGRHAEARAELLEAIAAAPPGTITRAYALKDAARSALADGDLAAASAHLDAARAEVTAGAFGEVEPWLHLLEAERLDRHGDAAAAAPLYELAWHGFVERLAPPQACEAALAWAASRSGAGDLAGARQVLERAARLAELHLFRQENPLARIESALESTGPDGAVEVLRGRVRRMLGGVDERWLLEPRSGDYHHRRLRGARALVTVWTCDLRGFTEFCARADDPAPVVAMLNRFFARIGQALLDRGGCIDKYVGDSILAYFSGADAAVAATHDAFARLDALNAERSHLGEPALAMGVGLATGWVVEGNVGFAGKLEHTIIGTPVNTACRLVARASGGQALLDEATARGLA
ncbi:MAG: tetratricopeptide repeat protein, partial [Myxococcales bacterium]